MTLQTQADTSPEAMQKMIAAFEPFGVGKEQIEKRINADRCDSACPGCHAENASTSACAMR